jgi:hypothetical protein
LWVPLTGRRRVAVGTVNAATAYTATR